MIAKRIGGVMVSEITCDISWVRARSGQTNDYKIGIYCFSTKHAP